MNEPVYYIAESTLRRLVEATRNLQRLDHTSAPADEVNHAVYIFNSLIDQVRMNHAAPAVFLDESKAVNIGPNSITSLSAAPEPAELLLNLHKLAPITRRIRNDIKRTVDLESLRPDPGLPKSPAVQSAIKVSLDVDNVLALDKLVKAVFDE